MQMDSYELKARDELRSWLKKMNKDSSMTAKFAKKIQTQVNRVIPEKVHHVVTTSMKGMIQATLIGSEYTTNRKRELATTLEGKEKQVLATLNSYKKTAAAEGAGTGAGGILLGLADLPLLLGIKMKFLFEAATLYGYDVKDFRERLFLLYLFQAAFSSEEKRKEVLPKLIHWDEYSKQIPDKKEYLQTIDWKEFQLEYRDHIELVKMLQLIPGFGALVGAAANFQFLDVLGETAMNGFRLRLFSNAIGLDKTF